MNDNHSKEVEKNSQILSPSTPTSLITSPEKQENNYSTPHATAKSSPGSNIPNNETESFILESGALMCAVTGTIPLSGKHSSESTINCSGQQNSCGSKPNSLRNSISKFWQRFYIFLISIVLQFHVNMNKRSILR